MDQPWTYKLVHGAEHPDNKEPVTKIGEATEEAVEKEEAAVNAEYAKYHEVAAEEKGKPASAQAVNYDAKTVHELKELALQRGVDIAWDARKDEIIKALEKQDKKG